MEKVVEFSGYQSYVKLSDKKAEEGDLLGAIRLLFSALNVGGEPEVYADIADIYAEMGLYEKSNKYWLKYLDNVPKEKRGEAYEQLAVNFFYLENLFASSYYFHKKVLTDGFISQDGLSEDIIDFFSDSSAKKKLYRIAYPFDKADYSFELSAAKRALVNGDYLTAIKFYSSVPKECKQYFEASNELSIVYFLTGEIDKAIALTRENIKENGEKTSLLCNLSSMYGYKKDDEKAEYYYKKAKEIFDGDKEGMYKLATCSLERGDTKTAVEFLEKIVEERPYEINMSYLYALALANYGDFAKAEKIMKKVLFLKPDDVVIKYYVEVFSKMQSSNLYDGIFPLEYIDDLPKSERQRRTRKIDQLLSSDPLKLDDKLKDDFARESLIWGVEKGTEKTVKKSIFLLSQMKGEKAKRIIKNHLLDPEMSDDTKRAMLFILIMTGEMKSLSVIIRGFYMKIKPRDLPCKKDPDGMVFYSAYALGLSRMIFSETSDFDKLAFATDKIYKKLKNKATEYAFDKESLATLIVSESKIGDSKNVDNLMQIFGAKKDSFDKIKKLYDGEIKNENN